MRSCRGFTLTELIMVIVITAIIGTVSVQFISYSTQGAVDTASRQQLANAAAVISQQVSRELRSALPGSIREVDGGRCIEYWPVLAASTYLDLPLTSAEPSFRAVAASPAQDFSGRVAVYPLATGNPYNLASPGPISALATVPAGEGEVTAGFNGGATHQFTTDSPSRRFFVVAEPRAICGDGAFLYRYRNYGVYAQASAAGSAWGGLSYPEREVLATPLAPDSVQFHYSPPDLRRNGVVNFEYTLQNPDTDEKLTLNQEVHIRNVP